MSRVRIEQRPGRRASGPSTFEWPRVSAEAVGCDGSMLERAAELAAENRSDSLLVIRDGALVLERYWNDKTANDRLIYQQCPTAGAFGPALSLARGMPPWPLPG